MPLPELFFVYDTEEREFMTFPSEAEAFAAYEKRITQIDKEAGPGGEYDGDELVYHGRVTHRAEVVPVGLDDREVEVFGLCSYAMGAVE